MPIWKGSEQTSFFLKCCTCCWLILDDERDDTLAAHHVHETYTRNKIYQHYLHDTKKRYAIKTFDVNPTRSVNVNFFNHSIQIVAGQLVINLSQNVLQGLSCYVAVPWNKWRTYSYAFTSWIAFVLSFYLPCRTTGKRLSVPFASPRRPLHRGCRKQ